jgi:hypothetical protein
MTNKELQDILAQFPLNLEVVAFSEDGELDEDEELIISLKVSKTKKYILIGDKK